MIERFSSHPIYLKQLGLIVKTRVYIIICTRWCTNIYLHQHQKNRYYQLYFYIYLATISYPRFSASCSMFLPILPYPKIRVYIEVKKFICTESAGRLQRECTMAKNAKLNFHYVKVK